MRKLSPGKAEFCLIQVKLGVMADSCYITNYSDWVPTSPRGRDWVTELAVNSITENLLFKRKMEKYNGVKG